MKAMRTKAWVCSFCKHMYRDRAAAESCCLCIECGKRMGCYTGPRSICKPCVAARELASALDNMEHAKARLRKAQTGHVR
jgi:hypothetical protein